MNALPQHLRVIDDAGREIFVDKPHTDEGMSFREDDKWIQPCLFEARCVEQRQVQTGSDLPQQDVAGTTHLLALAFEALRRENIGDGMTDERGPNGFGNLPRPGFLPLHIAIHRWITACSEELLGGLPQNDIYAGVGRSNEGGEEFRRRRRAAPMGRRQKVHIHLGCAERSSLALGDDVDFRATGRSEAGQEDRIEF